MKTSLFNKLVKNSEVVYEGGLATLTINSEGVVIDVFMWDEDEELQEENVNVLLSKYQKRFLQRKIESFVDDYNQENNCNTEYGFSDDDLMHFERLIHY